MNYDRRPTINDPRILGIIRSASVRRILSAPREAEEAAIYLGTRSLASSSSLPDAVILPREGEEGAGHSATGTLFGLAPRGVYTAVPVTRSAVSSYLTISPLPLAGRYLFCCTFRRLSGTIARAGLDAQPLAGTLPCGVRTFLRDDIAATARRTPDDAKERESWRRRDGGESVISCPWSVALSLLLLTTDSRSA